jgi:prepilin-type N-terminal cleavage/methylation domain-containing protein
MNAENGRRPGFTLLELMLTLTIFATVMTLMLNAFFQFSDHDRRLHALIDLRQEARILEGLIREDLQAAVFLEAYVSDPLKEMEGRQSGIFGENLTQGGHDADRIHLHINRPSRFYRTLTADQDPELHEVSYYVEPTEDDRLGLKRRESFYIDPDIDESIENMVYTLSTSVVSFDIRYFAGAETEGREAWDATQKTDERAGYLGLPTGVQVDLVLQNPAGEEYRTTFQVNLKPDMGSFVQWK